MPEPLNNENREDFLDRCMIDAESEMTFPDTDQRFAFCNSQWDNRNKEKKQDMKTGYGNKSTSLEVKEVDTDSRIVAGYFSAFNNIDSDGDMIMQGAFTKSIQEHGVNSDSNRKISHLAFHDVTRPVGNLKVLREDERGLYFESELGTHDDGENALKMYKDGIIKEHSIGFNYISDKTNFIEVEKEKTEHPLVKQLGGYWSISEVKLWEGSFVTFGANAETPNLTNIKSQDDLNNVLSDLKQRMETFIKALKDGNYSQKYNNLFEVELMQITKQFESLVKFEPFQKESQSNEKSDSEKQKEETKRIVSILKTIKI